jgi:tetratricopeptide (TPR) repeat protein
MPSAAFAVVLALSLQAAQPAPAPSTGTGTGTSFYEFMLSRHLENQGDEAGALEALKRAQAADPKSADIRAEMAGMYARQNKAAEAVEAAEQALKIDPSSGEAHRILGLVFAAWADGSGSPPAGRAPEQLRRDAIEHLTKILDSPAVATDLSLQVTLGRLHMRVGQPDKAIPILENVVSQAPFAVEPYTLLADARLAVGRMDEAAQALAMAAEIDPRRYLSLGELYERQGRWAEAAEAYSNGVQASRTPSRDLRLRLIGALLNLNDADATRRARDQANEILKTTPQDVRALAYIARAERQLGNFAGAEEAARKVLAAEPKNATAMFELLAIYNSTKQYPRAVELAANAVKEYPDEPRFVYLYADALANTDKVAEATRLLQGLIDKDPLNADALNSLGYMLAERGVRLPEAVTFIERALKVDPENPAFLDSLAWALFKQGKAEEAEAPMRKAATAMPRESVIQDHLGDVLARRGKSDEAVSAWERALAGDGLGIDRAAVEKKIKDARGRRK